MNFSKTTRNHTVAARAKRGKMATGKNAGSLLRIAQSARSVTEEEDEEEERKDDDEKVGNLHATNFCSPGETKVRDGL